jgi:hypothetical protein
MKRSFDEVLNMVPEEQQALVERMMFAKLVSKLESHDRSQLSVTHYTAAGREFMRLFSAIVAPEPGKREASLIALHELSKGHTYFSGFSQE